jgi:hypothetical protein
MTARPTFQIGDTALDDALAGFLVFGDPAAPHRREALHIT